MLSHYVATLHLVSVLVYFVIPSFGLSEIRLLRLVQVQVSPRWTAAEVCSLSWGRPETAGWCWAPVCCWSSLPTSPVRFGLLSAGAWIAPHGGCNLHFLSWPVTLSLLAVWAVSSIAGRCHERSVSVCVLYAGLLCLLLVGNQHFFSASGEELHLESRVCESTYSFLDHASGMISRIMVASSLS